MKSTGWMAARGKVTRLAPSVRTSCKRFHTRPTHETDKFFSYYDHSCYYANSLCTPNGKMRSSFFLLCLTAFLLLTGDGVEGRPASSVALGPRPAVQPNPIIIPDEEAEGKPMEQMEQAVPAEVQEEVDADEEEDKGNIQAQGSGTGATNAAVGPATSGTGSGTGAASNTNDQSTTTAKPTEKSGDDESAKIFGLEIWIFCLIVLLIVIVCGVLIWLMVRHRKKKALRAAGMNAEVKSVTPIVTGDGTMANVVTMEPISTGTSGGSSNTPS